MSPCALYFPTGTHWKGDRGSHSGCGRGGRNLKQLPAHLSLLMWPHRGQRVPLTFLVLSKDGRWSIVCSLFLLAHTGRCLSGGKNTRVDAA